MKGRIVDLQGKALPGAGIQLVDHKHILARTASSPEGAFELKVESAGEFTVRVEAAGFRAVSRSVVVRATGNDAIEIRMSSLSVLTESVTVTADVKDIDVLAPDPAEKVFASEDLLDANPGRPGAPISIPGYPMETASSGIKAPQYFAPGVAGDHGEPIAQYIQVGSYLVPNNLSANAHGNGYADPNIYIANVIESVQVDGGAFNVREGNHALNLATTYSAALASRSLPHPDRRQPGHHGHGGVESFTNIRGSRWRAPTAMDSWTGWSTASSSSSMAGRFSTLEIIR